MLDHFVCARRPAASRRIAFAKPGNVDRNPMSIAALDDVHQRLFLGKEYDGAGYQENGRGERREDKP